jgi:N-acetyl-anhydromuramyl-L-alanine amidase AmpD
VNSVNPTSIGVAFANDGTEPYRPAQYKAGARLVADICKRHQIPTHMIRGHYEVSPGRKTDPWKHFDWGEFYRLLGLFAGDKVA